MTTFHPLINFILALCLVLSGCTYQGTVLPSSKGGTGTTNRSFPLNSTAVGSSPTSFVGLNASNGFFIDSSLGPDLISTSGSAVVLDADNNSTTAYWGVKRDATNISSAVDVARIVEDGTFWVASSPTVTAGYGIGTLRTVTGTSSSYSGVEGQIIANPGSSSSATVYGLVGQAGTGSGNAQNFTATPGIAGVTGGVIHRGSGTLSHAASVYAGGLNNTGGGTVTNQYGLFVPALANATNNYAIYTSGSSNPAYIAGSIGVGAAPSTYKATFYGAANNTVAGSVFTQNPDETSAAGAVFNVKSGNAGDPASGYLGAFHGAYGSSYAQNKVMLANNSDANGIVIHATQAGNTISLRTSTNERVAIADSGVSIVNGDLTVAGAGTNSQRLGTSSTAAGTGDVAIGHSAAASSGAATALGYQSAASGNSATALGKGATAAGASATAVGTATNTNDAVTSIALGVSSTVSAGANYGVALGGGTTAAYTKSVALGYQAITTAANQFVVGAVADVVDWLAYGHITIGTAGKGLRIKEGSNARMGTATLSSGTVTINNTSVTANTRVIAFRAAGNGTRGFLEQGTVTPGTSFVINSVDSAGSLVNDASTLNWILFEPAP